MSFPSNGQFPAAYRNPNHDQPNAAWHYPASYVPQRGVQVQIPSLSHHGPGQSHYQHGGYNQYPIQGHRTNTMPEMQADHSSPHLLPSNQYSSALPPTINQSVPLSSSVSYSRYSRQPPSLHQGNQQSNLPTASNQYLSLSQPISKQPEQLESPASFAGTPKRSSHVAPSMVTQPRVEIPSRTSEPKIDLQCVMLSLAEEYFAAARSENFSVSSSQLHTKLDAYCKLISTGLGCLEAVLRDYRLQPRLEATIRLRYASILYEETENYFEAEENLSKGISICDRHRLLDLKYNMQYLLAKIIFIGNPKASLKYTDDRVNDLEAYGHTPWIYVFRFLRFSLSLQTLSLQDSLAGFGHLKSIATLASSRGHPAVSMAASTMEALAHLRESSTAESIEQAQRALAIARSSQLYPAAQNIPQLNLMMHFVDICCSLQSSDPVQAWTKMQAMQASLDDTSTSAQWQDDGTMTIPLNRDARMPALGTTYELGLVRPAKDELLTIQLSWLPKDEVLALGFLLCGAAVCSKNAFDGHKSEQYIRQGSRLLKDAIRGSGTLGESICAQSSRQLWRKTTLCNMRILLVFNLCARTEWGEAKKQLDDLNTQIQEIQAEPSGDLAVTVRYLEGIVFQGQGDLNSALNVYRSAELALPGASTGKKSSQTHSDIALLSALNSIFIIRDPDHPEHHSLFSMLPVIEPLCLSNPNKNIVSAYYLARATSCSDESTGIVKTKQYLQTALTAAKQTANNQLLCITLNLMSWKFFRGVVGEQAEKSAVASQNLAKKGQDHLWTSVADGLLADTLEVQGKVAEAEAVRNEAINLAGKLPPAMQRVVESK